MELSILAANKQFAYKITDDRIAIFKLHGSINWRLGVPDHPTIKWCPFDFTKGMMTEEVYHAQILLHPHSWQNISGSLGEVEPFIVLPGFGKAFDVRRLAPFWYKPEFAFAFTHDIFIISLSLARDDFIVKSLFLDNLPYIADSRTPDRKILIINPDPVVRDNFGFLVGDRHIDFRCEPFEMKHIGLVAPTVSK